MKVKAQTIEMTGGQTSRINKRLSKCWKALKRNLIKKRNKIQNTVCIFNIQIVIKNMEQS